MLGLITERKADIAGLCVRHKVKSLEVFGSAARVSDFDAKRSDVDFLVEFDQDTGISPLDQYFGLRDGLASLLGLRIDLIEDSAVKNPHIRREIDRFRVLVYAG
jgi:uncharacterized protein